jgi:hypothetical protein
MEKRSSKRKLKRFLLVISLRRKNQKRPREAMIISEEETTVVAVEEADVVATSVLALLLGVTEERGVMMQMTSMLAAEMKTSVLIKSLPNVLPTRKRIWLWTITTILLYDRIIYRLYSEACASIVFGDCSSNLFCFFNYFSLS